MKGGSGTGRNEHDEGAQILFAVQNDEEELREILWAYEMDISGEIEDHLIIKEDGKVLAGER